MPLQLPLCDYCTSFRCLRELLPHIVACRHPKWFTPSEPVTLLLVLSARVPG